MLLLMLVVILSVVTWRVGDDVMWQDVPVDWCKLVAAFVPVQAAWVAVNVNGLPDPSIEPVRVFVKDFDFFPVNWVIRGFE